MNAKLICDNEMKNWDNLVRTELASSRQRHLSRTAIELI